MSYENTAAAHLIPPRQLDRDHLFDAITYPPSLVLFIGAALEPDMSHHSMDLAHPLHEAGLPTASKYAVRQCLSLLNRGYLGEVTMPAESPSTNRIVQVDPRFLSYRLLQAIMIVEEATRPEGAEFIDTVLGGRNQLFSPDFPGIPSLSVALCRQLLAEEEVAMPIPSVYPSHFYQRFGPPVEVYHRVHLLLKREVIAASGDNGIRLAPEYRDPISDFLARLSMFEQAVGLLKSHDEAPERAGAILEDTDIIDALVVAAIKRSGGTKAVRKSRAIKRRPAVARPSVDATAQSQSRQAKQILPRLPVTLRAGVYPANWLDRGKCITEKSNPHWFDSKLASDRLKAQAYCKRCPVAAACLKSALLDENESVAALTPEQRKLLTHAEQEEILNEVIIEPWPSRGEKVRPMRA